MKGMIIMLAMLLLCNGLLKAEGLKLSVDQPEVVQLGELAIVKVTLMYDESIEVFPLAQQWYGVSLRIGLDGREFLYTRFKPAFRSGTYPQAPSMTKMMKKGEKETLSIPLLLPKAAKYTIRAEYRGRSDHKSGIAPLLSLPKGLTIVAKQGNIDSLTVKVESSHGNFSIAFWPHEALGTVLNFLHLCDQGFYNGISFHRIIDGFMSQGGDPKGDGSSGPGYSISHEFNARRHTKGVISMARSQHNDSAGSQFFICAERAEFLDRNYTGFGQVIDGMKVVQKINDIGSDDPNGMPPRDKVLIKSMKIMLGNQSLKTR